MSAKKVKSSPLGHGNGGRDSGSTAHEHNWGGQNVRVPCRSSSRYRDQRKKNTRTKQRNAAQQKQNGQQNGRRKKAESAAVSGGTKKKHTHTQQTYILIFGIIYLNLQTTGTPP